MIKIASKNYATVDDLVSLWKPLSESERAQASELMGIVSAEIRAAARKTGRDFGQMLYENPDLAEIAKSVVCDVVRRYMNDSRSDTPSMSQLTESGGGYSVSGTFLVPGGGLFLKRTELARLGLRRQKIGAINLCG